MSHAVESGASKEGTPTPSSYAARATTKIDYVGAAAPLAALAGMVLFATLLVGATIDCDSWIVKGGRCQLPGAAVPDGGNASPFGELRTRLVWAIAVLVAVLAIGGAIAAADVLLRRAAGPVSGRRLRASIVLTGLILGIINFGWFVEGSYAFSKELIGKTVFRISYANYFVSAIEVLGQTALVAIAVAVGVMVRAAERECRREDVTLDVRAASLAGRLRDIRLLLVLGAAGLAAAAMETAALYEWASVIRGDSGYIRPAENASGIMSAVVGAYYSILLTAVFAPVLFRLYSLANRTADVSGVGGTERAAWMQLHGLDMSLPRKLISVLAILAPLLAGGPAAELLAALTR